MFLTEFGSFSTPPPPNYDKIHQSMMHTKAIISIEVKSETCSINRNQYQSFQSEYKDQPKHFPKKALHVAKSTQQPYNFSPFAGKSGVRASPLGNPFSEPLCAPLGGRNGELGNVSSYVALERAAGA